jgi:hypothetical protein
MVLAGLAQLAGLRPLPPLAPAWPGADADSFWDSRPVGGATSADSSQMTTAEAPTSVSESGPNPASATGRATIADGWSWLRQRAAGIGV